MIVLHDAVLQHFALGYFSRDEYISKLTHNYGEWTRDLAATLWSNRARSGGDSEYFRYPMVKRIAETARAVVVHNQAAGTAVRNHAATANIVEIPHLLAPLDLPACRKPRFFKRSSGAVPLFGVFGHLQK